MFGRMLLSWLMLCTFLDLKVVPLAAANTCKAGEYFFQFDGECHLCINCSRYYREEIQPCSLYKNTVCGKCFTGLSDDMFQGSSSSDVVYPCTEVEEVEDNFMAVDQQFLEQAESNPLEATKKTAAVKWQIVVPVICGVAVVIGLAVFIVVRRCRNRSTTVAEQEEGQGEGHGRNEDVENALLPPARPLGVISEDPRPQQRINQWAT